MAALSGADHQGSDPASWLATLSGPSHLTERDEKVVLLILTQIQQLNERVSRLEKKLDAALQESFTRPDQEDLLELRLVSARLAAELSRVTVELRSEIADLAASVAPVAVPTSPELATDEPPRPPDPEVDTAEHEVIDLTGSPRRRRSSGWRPAQGS